MKRLSIAVCLLAGALLASAGALFAEPPAKIVLVKEPPMKSGTVFRDCADICPEMVVIPAGKFMMGSTPEDIQKYLNLSSSGDEGPRHEVTFDRPFAVGRFTVTRGQFGQFVNETGWVAPNDCTVWNGGKDAKGHLLPTPGMNWEHNPTSTTDEQPVVCLGYNDMKAYTNWLSQKTGRYYRLETEAEYEYTARAGTTTLWFFGDNPDELCTYGNVDDLTVKEEAEANGELAPTAPPGWPNCRDGVGLRTAPVGSYKPNPWGLYDTYGNVWQRVEDCYHTSYKDAPRDGSVAWTYGIKNENGVPVDCGYRVVRGGGWRNAVFHLRAANRYGDYPDYHRADYVGFRIARALEPEPAKPGPGPQNVERERAGNPPQ